MKNTTSKNFMNTLFDLRCKIVENCCLIIYAKTNGEILQNVEKELSEQINSIRAVIIENENKEKIIRKELIQYDDLDDFNMIKKIVAYKFQKENIELREEYITKFISSLDDLILCLTERISINDFLFTLN